jgi:small subunit ribosomal protein S9
MNLFCQCRFLATAVRVPRPSLRSGAYTQLRQLSTTKRNAAEDSIIKYTADGEANQQVALDAAAENSVFAAAPEINFAGEDPEVYNHALPLLSRIRIVPDSPSYFSGQPESTDEFLYIQALYNRYLSLPRVGGFDDGSAVAESRQSVKKAARNPWRKFEDFRANSGRPMKRQRYDEIVEMLNSLAAIEPVLMPLSVSGVIQEYRHTQSTAKRHKIKLGLDTWGRGIGVGRRKSASAQVHLVKGQGEVLINGRGLAEAFPRLHDRESALWPLKITSRMDKYNVWALVKGGGSTGQAEAITLGVAKALLLHEPALQQRLYHGTFIFYSASFDFCADANSE